MLVVARVEAEPHDVRRDFVREARTREYFLEHGHEARDMCLFIRSPGADRRDLCYVLAPRWFVMGRRRFHPPSICSSRERRTTAEEAERRGRGSPAGARRRRRSASAFSGRRALGARRPGRQRTEGLRVTPGAAGPDGGDPGQLVAGRRRVRVCIGGRTACLETLTARAEHPTVARHVGARARGLRHSHI